MTVLILILPDHYSLFKKMKVIGLKTATMIKITRRDKNNGKRGYQKANDSQMFSSSRQMRSKVKKKKRQKRKKKRKRHMKPKLQFKDSLNSIDSNSVAEDFKFKPVLSKFGGSSNRFGRSSIGSDLMDKAYEPSN